MESRVLTVYLTGKSGLGFFDFATSDEMVEHSVFSARTSNSTHDCLGDIYPQKTRSLTIPQGLVYNQKFELRLARRSLSARMTSLNLLNASLTSASESRLNEALTYPVFWPFGRKTVPGKASTPFSKALVRIIVSESPTSCASGLRRSLNLLRNRVRSVSIQCVCREKGIPSPCTRRTSQHWACSIPLILPFRDSLA